MSCYIVDDADIDFLVSAAIHFEVALDYPDRSEISRGRGLQLDEARAAGLYLARVNLQSVNARYPSDASSLEDVNYSFRRRYTSNLIALAKLARCYRYQSCEHDGWDNSEANRFIDHLLSRLWDHLPGYSAAPWGTDGDAGKIRQVEARQPAIVTA